jgi:tRNA pseudouridine38-40 synthase
VQGEIERALSEICDEPVRVTGAGRTDTGVHATGQVIDFRTASALDGGTMERGVNALLPKDIAIADVEAASEDFHSRFSATGRTYEYRIRNAKGRDPLARLYEHWIPDALDLRLMREASALVVRREDFAAFAAGVSGERTVRRAEWTTDGDQLRFLIEADAFLRGMVRGIVGTLIWVGRGKIAPDHFGEILRSRDRAQAGPSAPAQGLCLIRVDYGGERQSESENDE